MRVLAAAIALLYLQLLAAYAEKLGWAVLAGEFWCRDLLLACLARGVAVAIRPRGAGRRPVGLKVDMGWYWVRKLCEQVFGCLAKRRHLLLSKTVEGAVVASARWL